MTESERDPGQQGGARGELTAGAMLRAARERQGTHIAVLAAAIKVSPRKLDALEGDRYHELPDATFVRALAQTVCRALKIDAQPILERLPRATGHGLEQVNGGLNAPFRDRPGRVEPGASMPQRPLVWAGGLLLLAAALIVLLPASTWRFFEGDETAAPAAAAPVPASAPALASLAASSAVSAASAAASAPAVAPTVETVHSAPADAPASEVPTRAALIKTSEPSWIEVLDAGGQPLLSRIVQPGEAVAVDGALPLRLKIGNARATQLAFRGQPVDLAASTRDNVARVELK